MSKINQRQFEIFKMLLQKHLDSTKNFDAYTELDAFEENFQKWKILAANSQAIIGALEEMGNKYEAFTASRN